jgi:hypothetical protein
MGNITRPVRAGIMVGIASTLVTGVVVSFAVSGAAGTATVGAAGRPTVFESVPVTTLAPPVTPVMADIRSELPTTVTTATPTTATPTTTVTVVPKPQVVVDRVVLVGDSLADEASSVVRYLTPGIEMVPRYFGGTAPCDWFDRDLEATATSVVVISFTGNNFLDCMLDAAGERIIDDELVAKYRVDVGVLVDRALTAGAWVVLVGQPNHHAERGAEEEIPGLNVVYQELAETLPRVSFVDAGAAVETPDGQYTDRLPCTEHDIDCAPDGTTVVRGDGVHFCPVVQVHPCPVWSSGAVRFGGAIAEAVNDPAQFD